MDEKTALTRLKQGDIGALEYLMELYYTQAVRTAFLIVRDESLAEDITQGAFIRVFERAGQYDVNRPFKFWFSRIIVNDAILAARRRERTVSLEQLSANSDDPLAEYLGNLTDPNQLSPEIIFEKAETNQEIWQVLSQLNPEQRAVIVLRYYLGFSETQIAEHQASPPGTIKWRLHSARKRLRSLIGPENL
ncbi:MAG: sigma-70 family RNA polymerase sigma factor [Chloroflexi bacterium]|nr:sigma-70 family RNA polymerase sigma factor [Chloroflexota bacterium]OJW06253.1 MAG: hypothetical protein BGO39_25775 [Chloroflexi bacterium 54-19]